MRTRKAAVFGGFAPPQSASVSPSAHPMQDRRLWRPVGLVVLGFVVLAVSLALTRPPHADEGHFASAAASFATRGRLVMPMWTEWISTLDQHVYATMPLYFVALGGWFRMFGTTFVGMRLFSVLWGIGLVIGWSTVVGHVTNRREGAILGAMLVGLDYDIVNLTTARYDVMCAALNVLALVAYLKLRERHLPAAAAAASALVTVSSLVHPYGTFGMMTVGMFALILDGRRLVDRRVIVAALAPFSVGMIGWATYIAQDPALFRAQFSANAGGRLAGYRTPLAAFATDIRERYLTLYGGLREGVPRVMRLKLLILAAYLVGIAGSVVIAIRSRRPHVVALATATITAFLMLVLLENNRWYIYLIHVLPLYAACTAVTATALLDRGPITRRLVWTGVTLSALFAVASVAYRARQNVQGRAFEPALAYLQSHVAPGDLVMAGGEFGVGLGFANHVLDDPLFGYHNGRQPVWIVESRDYEKTQREDAVGTPAAGEHVARVLVAYHEVFASERAGYTYRILRRP